MMRFFFWGIFFFSNVKSEEFCNSEIFKPECLHNEVLYIEKAFFGRKYIGKCIKEEGEFDEYLSKIPGYINCYSDVENIIEPYCAGKQRCEMFVASISSETNCSKVFLKHLDVSYQCLKGIVKFSCILRRIFLFNFKKHF